MRSYLVLLLLLLCATCIASQVYAGTTDLISVAIDGTSGNGLSDCPSVSADGRFVAFESAASNLVPNIPAYQVYVRDRLTGKTECVSVSPDGTPAGGWSPVISADGHAVVFLSGAADLSSEATNDPAPHIYIYDRQTGKTDIVDKVDDGSQLSYYPVLAVSADERFISYPVRYDQSEHLGDQIYVYDRDTGKNELVSVSSDGAQITQNNSNASMSADGRYITFESIAPYGSAVPEVYVHDRLTGKTEILSNNWEYPGYGQVSTCISANGRFVAFTAVSNAATGYQFALHDGLIGDTEIASIGCDGVPVNTVVGSPSISADGRFLAFCAYSELGEQVYVHDRLTAKTECVSAPYDSTQPFQDGYGKVDYGYFNYIEYDPVIRISANGKSVVYSSFAGNLVSMDTNRTDDVFARDITKADMLAGLAVDGSAWFTRDMRTWACVPGMISYMVNGNVNCGFVGLAYDGSIWSTDLSTAWTNIPGCLETAAVGSFDGLGTDGLAGLSMDGSIWYTNDLNTWSNIPGKLVSLVAADFNGDGKCGIAGIASDGSVWCTSDLTSWTNIPGCLRVITAGDFLGDGKSEVAGIAPDLSIWFSPDEATWKNIPGRLVSLVTGDFDGNGKDGIAGLAENGSIWYTNDLTNWTSIPGNLCSLVVGDFNGDGSDDLAGLAEDGSIWYTTDKQTWNMIPGRLSSLYSSAPGTGGSILSIL